MRITDGEVRLTVSYCVPNVESDSETFFEIIGGRQETTRLEAVESVMAQAKSFADKLRQGYPNLDVSVFDDCGQY